MQVDAISGTSSAVTAVVRQVQAVTEMQMEIMKQLAESQQQMVAMLQEAGIGQYIDLQA